MEEVTSYYSCLSDIELCTCELVSVVCKRSNDPAHVSVKSLSYVRPCSLVQVTLCVSSGVLIYFGYGMWNSTLEITARENEVHASTYQRYDQGVDEGFCGFDDDFYPPTSDAWGGAEDGSGGTAPPVAKPKGGGEPLRDGDRTVANRALAEEDPMDF